MFAGIANMVLGRFKDISLSDSPEKVVALLSEYGIVDKDGLVPMALTAALKVSSNPEESIAEFVCNGGLMRLLAGPQQEGDDDEMVLQCPHCQKSIIV